MRNAAANIQLRRVPAAYILVFLAMAAAVGAAGYSYYSVQKKNTTIYQHNELSTIADLKVGQIRNWRTERMNDAEAITGSPIFAAYVKGYLAGPRPATRINILKRMEALNRHEEYETILLVDREGTVLLAAGKGNVTEGGRGPDAVLEAMSGKTVVLTELRRVNPVDVRMDLIAPLAGPGPAGGHVVGALVMRIDPARFLYPAIQAWPTPSPSGETLLVRRDGDDVLFLNELRHRKGTALALRIPADAPDLPAAMLVRGESGIVEGTDYRGTAVLADLHRVPDSAWFLVTKIDAHEVYAPVHEHAVYIGVIVASLIVLAGTAIGFIWRRESMLHYRSLFESESRRLEEHQAADRALREGEERLRKTNADLVRSNRELEQFGYIASHDLQEPLRMVASYLELIERRYKGKLDESADEFIGYAVGGAVRMQRMINDLLAYSRVGTKGGAFEPVDCGEALDQALANLRLKIRESGAVITRDPLPVIRADMSQIVQVFQNLISNSIKFRGQARPEIHVSAGQKGDEWQFLVRDNGIGFDPAYAENIFVIFKRLHPVSAYPGSGIGLTICRKIIERHGGRIWAESEAGKGTAFYFTITLEPSVE
jgi:signal transduction histidine kinase